VTRSVILKLLLAEEKSLGQTREQLQQIDSDIEKLRRTIAQQKKHIERFQFIGSVMHTERAIVILSTLNDLMATYQQHRQWITAGLADGSGV
jgi:septal ring factor EnvC (AmiA/AmiB activator)